MKKIALILILSFSFLSCVKEAAKLAVTDEIVSDPKNPFTPTAGNNIQITGDIYLDKTKIISCGCNGIWVRIHMSNLNSLKTTGKVYISFNNPYFSGAPKRTAFVPLPYKNRDTTYEISPYDNPAPSMGLVPYGLKIDSVKSDNPALIFKSNL